MHGAVCSEANYNVICENLVYKNDYEAKSVMLQWKTVAHVVATMPQIKQRLLYKCLCIMRYFHVMLMF